jgi:mono/diheme cytochrome c family protein
MNVKWAIAVLGVALLCGLGCQRAPEPQFQWRSKGVASYDVALGKTVYDHYCSTCHGDGGAGDGFNSYNLDPKPRDLTDARFQKKSDTELADVIRRGGAGVGQSTLMPPWRETLNERQITDVILYVRTLRK